MLALLAAGAVPAEQQRPPSIATARMCTSPQGRGRIRQRSGRAGGGTGRCCRSCACWLGLARAGEETSRAACAPRQAAPTAWWGMSTTTLSARSSPSSGEEPRRRSPLAMIPAQMFRQQSREWARRWFSRAGAAGFRTLAVLTACGKSERYRAFVDSVMSATLFASQR